MRLNRLLIPFAFLPCLALAAAKTPAPASAAPPAPPSGLQIQDIPQLQEIKGVVSWNTLAKVIQTPVNNRITPSFPKEIEALNGQDVKIQGFMMPLEAGPTQKHFLISVYSASCSYCMPAGPEGVVEVRSATPVKYGFEPIIVSGKLAVLKSDPMGLYYRLSNANLALAK